MEPEGSCGDSHCSSVSILRLSLCVLSSTLPCFLTVCSRCLSLSSPFHKYSWCPIGFSRRLLSFLAAAIPSIFVCTWICCAWLLALRPFSSEFLTYLSIQQASELSHHRQIPSHHPVSQASQPSMRASSPICRVVAYQRWFCLSSGPSGHGLPKFEFP